MQRAGERHGDGGSLTAEDRYLRMLLYAPGCTGRAGEPVAGRTPLLMQMYRVSRYVPDLGRAFGPRDLGALGAAVDAAYGRCAEAGLVAGGEDGGGIRLTPRGMGEAGALWGEADGDAREAVADTKEFLNDMGPWEMASFARSTYPEVAEAPGIAGMPEGVRLGAAASLVMRRKVSSGKGAEIAGMAIVDFVAELRRRGYEPYSSSAEDIEESIRVIDDILGR